MDDMEQAERLANTYWTAGRPNGWCTPIPT